MSLHRTIAGICCLLLFATCTSITTENDITPPNLSAWLYNVESEPVIFRATDSDMEVTNNCPTNNGYFMDLNNSTLEVGILASDPGGIDNMSIQISPVKRKDVRNVVLLNNPTLTPTVRQSAPLEVTITAHFTNRLTGQLIKFDVMGIDSVMLIDADAQDLLLHKVGFVDGDSGSFYPARVLLDDLCGS